MLILILLATLGATGGAIAFDGEVLYFLVAGAIGMCIGAYILSKNQKLISISAALLTVFVSNTMIRATQARESSVQLPEPIRWLGSESVVVVVAIIAILAAYGIGTFDRRRE